MRRLGLVLLILALSLGAASYAASSMPDKGQIYVEAEGRAVAPSGTSGAWAKLLARRGATVDLQRNLLQKLAQLQVDASALPREVRGFIRGVELFGGEWNGEVYTLKGRVRVKDGHVSVPARGK